MTTPRTKRASMRAPGSAAMSTLALVGVLSGAAACAAGRSGGASHSAPAPGLPPGAVPVPIADEVRPCPTPAEDTSLAVYDSAEVDRPVAVGRGGVAPRYPRELLQRGVTGGVVVRYVVNRAGCVEPASIEILEETDRRFGDAVAFALLRWRYEQPAVRDGLAVRQRIARQSFRFDIAH